MSRKKPQTWWVIKKTNGAFEADSLGSPWTWKTKSDLIFVDWLTPGDTAVKVKFVEVKKRGKR